MGWAAVGFLAVSCSTSALGLKCPGVTALAFIPLTEGIQRIPAAYRPRGRCWLRRESVELGEQWSHFGFPLPGTS